VHKGVGVREKKENSGKNGEVVGGKEVPFI